ncbi:YegS/Rv2252/BmrU family lipid kinase [candidate division KSB3 bacterium]|uniref:YegS/Rv2252/BmrU family lipid kinase n=1 Tax=candidate division KSB3 bacterium TaxID=2044937 RepID=A0A9D5JYY3_9BACT|nr:YegS/Rv2252/BmrU family lipid kinase [candidate division KSB3 bacterium]MBD3326740.1 YegS/Rv2252/BmrU family lipid kinase [candidate division KSB3 bacterium]
MKKLASTHALCILNPTAGGGKAAKRIRSELQATFRAAEQTYDLVTTQQKGDGTRLSQQAAQEGYDLVIAIGGDGTVNEVATGLIGASTALGIIPAGSGNGLARGLRIPLASHHACQLFLRPRIKAIDVGQVCRRHFFATSGVGFDAHLGQYYDQHVQHSRGFWPYVRFTLAEFFRYTPRPVQLHYQGQTWDYTPLLLTVANVNQYGGGAKIAPRAVPDDGMFDISILPRLHPLTALWYAPRLFLGTLDTMPQFIHHRARSLTLTRPEPGPVHVDGEPFLAGPTLEYTLLPGALRVCVP